MYMIILNQGVVVRTTDNKVVAPCQSVDDPDFVAYNAWINEGNEPVVYESDPEDRVWLS